VASPTVRNAILWQILGGFVALLVIAGSIGELIWCSLYFSDPTNVSQPFTGIVHGTATLAAVGLVLYHSRRRQREAAMRAGGSAALLEAYGYHFHLGSWSVRVQWMFLVMAGVGGAFTDDSSRILPFVAIATVAILAHELGHAAAAQAIRGENIRIELHAFGGLTTFEAVSPTRRQQVVVSLAGPAAGLGLGLIAVVTTKVFPHLGRHASYPDVLLATFGWSLLNLLPISPLDGAWLLDVVFRGRVNVFVVSCACSAAAIAACAITHHLGIILVFVILLIANILSIPSVGAAMKRWDARIG